METCERCQRNNGKLRKNHEPLHPVPIKDQAWSQIGIDLIGPLVETSHGNKFIMTITDYYTKWAEATAIKDKTAESVARVLYSVRFTNRNG